MLRKVYTTRRATSSGPYSHAVDSGDYIFLAGQTARNSIEDENKELTIAEETEECFKNLIDVLREADLSLDNVVKVNVFLTSMKDFQEMNQVYETKFKAPYPARTCVAVLELPLGAKVEIEMIAKR